jgi:hypothetical protein
VIHDVTKTREKDGRRTRTTTGPNFIESESNFIDSMSSFVSPNELKKNFWIWWKETNPEKWNKDEYTQSPKTKVFFSLVLLIQQSDALDTDGDGHGRRVNRNLFTSEPAALVESILKLL